MTLDASVHKNILIRILKEIYSDSSVGPLLGFKGGTAAYLFYDLSRVSVDLDFDLLDQEKGDYVFGQMQKIIEQYGEIKDARKKRYSYFYLLSYHSKIHGAYNIKVEINCRDFGSHYEVKSYLGIPMKVMVMADMSAHKMVAMLERIGSTNRDIFDTWFFLSHNWPINEVIIIKRTGLSLKDFLLKCIQELEAMSNRGILSGMGELLDAKQKNWVKKNLKDELIFLLRVKLEAVS